MLAHKNLFSVIRTFGRTVRRGTLQNKLEDLESKYSLSDPKKSPEDIMIEPQNQMQEFQKNNVKEILQNPQETEKDKLNKLLQMDNLSLTNDFENSYGINVNESEANFEDINKWKLKEKEKFTKEELIDNEYIENWNSLVRRPGKETVWGLGGQLMVRKKNFFDRDRMPEVDEVMYYLEMELIKDILKFDMREGARAKKTHFPKWVILGTALSTKHVYKSTKSMWKSFCDIEFDYTNQPTIHGRRDDDWSTVTVGDYFQIIICTAEAREDLNFEMKLNYDQEEDPDFEQWLKRTTAVQTNKKSLIEPLKRM